MSTLDPIKLMCVCLGYLINQSLCVVKVSNIALTIFYVCKTLCRMEMAVVRFFGKMK